MKLTDDINKNDSFQMFCDKCGNLGFTDFPVGDDPDKICECVKDTLILARSEKAA
ncbi:MAG: hypothetical protein Unbinned1190contig1000_28 [Prokaryotic dsDNA virus sp.]|nr:MAG: hypothetical protein Unbinned1190contig1000_28 [Prokaryotic dsDNA virus sp.]